MLLERGENRNDRGALDVDFVVAGFAARQHSLVHRRTLGELGLDRWAIRRRVAAGRLFDKGNGVFAVGHGRLTEHGRLMHASLSYGDGAPVAFRDAAALLGVLPPQRGRVHVIADTGTERDGTRLHRVPVHPRDVTSRHNIPVTALARTLADLAGDPLAARAVTEAHVKGLLKPHILERALLLSAGKPGAKTLRELLVPIDPGVRLRSPPEVRFRRLLEKDGIRAPEANFVVQIEGHRYELDVAWPEFKLAVELDAYSTHGATTTWEADHERDARLVRAGWQVLRFTRRQVYDRPDEVVATVRAFLEGGGMRTVSG